MNKKITRRAVLGTVIGGLAVAPFVVHHFRKPKLPSSAFAKNWERVLSKTNIPIKKIEGVKSFVTGFNLTEGMHFDYQTLFVNQIEGRVVENLSPDLLPQFFFEIEGKVAVQDFLPAYKLCFDVAVDKNIVFQSSNRTVNDETGRNYLLGANENSIISVALDKKNFQTMPIYDLPRPCSALISLLNSQCSKSDTHKLGDRWETLRGENGYEYPLTCEIVGFAEVANRKTFELSISRESNDFEKSYLLELLPDSPKFAPIREHYQNIEFKYLHKETRYIDIETGVTLYRTAYIHSDTRLIGTTKISCIDGYTVDKFLFV
jgi:hypothetical protein